jgi:hypothetical protein
MRCALVLIALVAAHAAHAQSQTHVLRYTPPANVFKAAIQPAEDYSFNGFNASVQVYQFRPFTGNIEQAFQQTLLRDWIAPMHKEENVGARPVFQKVAIPGADLAISARFDENIVGLPRPHLRMLIVVGKEASIVDASAGTMQSWQQAVPALNAMAGTLRIESARAPAPLGPKAGAAVAGLYQGMKAKYMATMINVTGSASYQTALHYYVFSPDGRVYRAYDKLEVPGGSAARFDFNAAERNDAMNSGRYTVDGGKLIITMNRDNPETIVADVPRDGILNIYSVAYKKQ